MLQYPLFESLQISMMRNQTAVEAPGSLPCYPPEGCLLLSYNTAVSRSCNRSRTVLVRGAVEPWGSTPALLQGQTMQQARETFHPPVRLTWRPLLCSTPLHSTCPVGKLLCTKLSTEGLSLCQLKKKKIFNRQLLNKTLHFSLSL